jgi:DNA-binding response OmpR family regulator
VRLVVESGGPVLDQDAVARLVEPFQRLGADRTGSQNGHGLGLSIVAAIAAAHRHARAAHPTARRTSRPNHPYDVVVLDRDLPGVHGDTICQMITNSENPAMILMLTAAGAPNDRVTGLALGADDYLAKPFHFPELILSVRALARRRPRAHSPTLEALLRASPGGLTAEQLLERAWDENTDPFTNAVKTTIARLRRKLGEPAAIHTTPGIGYRITATAPPRKH